VRIGLVSETKPAERRVALTDTGVAALVGDGHEVLVESGAGTGAGIVDAAYERVGAQLADAADAWATDLVVKVKEPVAREYPYLRESTALFTYLHLAADRELTREGHRHRVRDRRGQPRRSPLLLPMSEIAGRLAAHAAGQYLMHPHGGPGLLLSGSPGVAPAKVVILGGGVVGTQAALLAVGMRADVTILDVSPRRVRELEDLRGTHARVLESDPATMLAEVARADVVIGAVLVPGAAAPKLISRGDLAHLKSGALLIDVAIDQGGCFETSRPTTYDHPTYEVDGIVHYCVANMAGAVPHTSTRALTNATLPYIRRLANLGVDAALAHDPGLARGLNSHAGTLTHDAVAAAYA
jgi:alanine dehydrogenase